MNVSNGDVLLNNCVAGKTEQSNTIWGGCLIGEVRLYGLLLGTASLWTTWLYYLICCSKILLKVFILYLLLICSCCCLSLLSLEFGSSFWVSKNGYHFFYKYQNLKAKLWGHFFFLNRFLNKISILAKYSSLHLLS